MNIRIEFVQEKNIEMKTVTRGKVVGILEQAMNRTAYTFVCAVDQYHSCLMKPICGTAPKIHVVDDVVRQK